jgi:hypothetical protein
MKAKFLATFPFKLMILIVLAGVLYLGGHFFVTTSKINQAWMKQVQIPSTTAFDSTAFHSLIEGGAIWPIRDGISVTLGHASCNTLALRSPETVKLVDGVAGENGRQYIRELCESPQGERIREELANFNQSYPITARLHRQSNHLKVLFAPMVSAQPCCLYPKDAFQINGKQRLLQMVELFNRSPQQRYLKQITRFWQVRLKAFLATGK